MTRETMIAAIAWSTVVASSCAPGDAASNGKSGNGLIVTVAVQPFVAVDSATRDFRSNAFAESVTVRLAKMRGLQAYVGNRSADFTLRGTVSVRDGRTVIATSLWRPDENIAVWTGTFWRDDARIDNVVQDVATGVAEALYGDIARRTLTTTTESR